MDTTDIEKKSLEAHVELCAERYKFLETKLEAVEEKINNVENMIKELRDIMDVVTQKNNDRIIRWGSAVIGVLVATIGWMASRFVFQ